MCFNGNYLSLMVEPSEWHKYTNTKPKTKKQTLEAEKRKSDAAGASGFMMATYQKAS